MSHFIPQKLEPLKSPCKGKFSLARVAKHTVLSGTALGLFALSMGVVGAEEAAATELPEVQYAIDNLFLFGCAVLVLFMQAGFAMVES
ncbi:MAG: hypothetical protein QF437_13290, partial [Planctomycetota bacterium]|nr:hypothetical protein [Planctomycetota bacterium]